MTPEEKKAIQEWARVCWDEDWMNQRRWWTRLVNWYNWTFRRVYSEWYDESEIAASIISYMTDKGKESWKEEIYQPEICRTVERAEKALNTKQKKEIDTAVKHVVENYGETLKMLGEDDEADVSLCLSCHCMTHTIFYQDTDINGIMVMGYKCGKCGAPKQNIKKHCPCRTRFEHLAEIHKDMDLPTFVAMIRARLWNEDGKSKNI